MIVKLNGKSLDVSFDAEAVYRFSRQGGSVEELSEIKRGTALGRATSFANMVLLTWAMLKGDSRSEYPYPESLAREFYPTLPDKTFFDAIEKALEAGVSTQTEK